MTQEQYIRAVQINNRINHLNETLEHIKDTKKHRLWYAYKVTDSCLSDSWNLTAEWAMSRIGDILDKHDLMIRQEIEEEIEKLKKEIETL